MYIVFGIPIILIIFLLLGLIGFGYSIVTNILYIIFALGLVFYFLLGLWKGFKQWCLISQRGFVWCLVFSIINLFSYSFFPYYFYSSILVKTNSLEKGMIYSLLFASILFIILNFLESCFCDDKRKNNMICCAIILSLIGITTLVGSISYPSLKNKLLEESNGIIEEQNYKVTKNSFLRFDSEAYWDKNQRNCEHARFPFWTANAFYPFKFFKKGETVYLLEHPDKYSYIYYRGLFPTGKENLEECFLVVNKNKTKVGYVPKQFLEPIIN